MSEKVSKPKSLITRMGRALNKYSTPPLVNAYVNAVRQICGIGKIRVAKKHHGRFLELQSLLDRNEIEYDVYALSVVNAWWPWCKSKRMNSVSPSIFYGIASWDRFMRERDVFNADTKSADDEHAALYYEMLYAKLLISSILQSDKHPAIAKRIVGFALNVTKKFGRRTERAMEILCNTYGIEATSYVDLAQQIKARS